MADQPPLAGRSWPPREGAGGPASRGPAKRRKPLEAGLGKPGAKEAGYKAGKKNKHLREQALQEVGHDAGAFVGFVENRGEQGAQKVGNEAQAMDLVKKEVGFVKNHGEQGAQETSHEAQARYFVKKEVGFDANRGEARRARKRSATRRRPWTC